MTVSLAVLHVMRVNLLVLSSYVFANNQVEPPLFEVSLLVISSSIATSIMAGLPPGDLEYMLRHRSDNRGPAALAAVIVIQGIAAAAVMLRVVARRASKQPLKADDHWIFLTWVSEVFRPPSSLARVLAGRHELIHHKTIALAAAAISLWSKQHHLWQ